MEGGPGSTMNSMVQETIEQLPSDYIYTEMFKAIDIQ